MRDPDGRLGDLLAGRVPDLWPETPGGEPRSPSSPTPARRLVAGVVALVASAAGFVLIVRAFGGEERAAVEPSPSPVAFRDVEWLATVIPVSEFPNAVAVGEGGIWVSANDGDRNPEGDVVRIDPQSGEVVARILVRALPGWEFGGGGIATGQGSVWVTGSVRSSDGDRTDGCCDVIVQQIDPATDEMIDVVVVAPGNEGDVWVDDTGIWVVYFAGETRDELEVAHIDLVTHQVLARVRVPGTWSQTIFGAGGYVWTTALVPGTDDAYFGRGAYAYLTRIDPVSHDVRPVEDPNQSWAFAGPGIPWVEDEGGIRRFDPQLGMLVGGVIAFPPGSDCCWPLLSDGRGGAWVVYADGPVEERGLWHVDADGVLDGSGKIGSRDSADTWGGVAEGFDPITQTIWIVHSRDSVTRIELR